MKREFGRAKYKDNYYYFTDVFCTHIAEENNKELNELDYTSGNYFLTEKECADAARVVSLWLQMKRFADEHNKVKLDFNDGNTFTYFIFYNFSIDKLVVDLSLGIKNVFQIYFDSTETAQKAIDKFQDELIWYFTEYGKEN